MAFDPITAVANLANTVLGRVLPDKTAQEAAKAQLLEMQLNGELSSITEQIQVDNTEAASHSTFVAGWRPFIGWTCGFGLAYQFVARPLLTFGTALFRHPVDAPSLDLGTLTQLLIGMLGIAGMRTFEKIQGVDGNTKNSGS